MKQRILVAEDHILLLEGIRDILESEGYTVLSVTDGIQALQTMNQTLPDLVIADIMMPVLDGYALLKEIRARPEWSHTPIIFLTSRAENEDIQRGHDLGVEGYITKPFDPDDLLNTVRTVLEST
ncbi:MAG TPA: response regulator [Chloroflexi bacterium]|nr:response regulator [Chloroflexota bacterium]